MQEQSTAQSIHKEQAPPPSPEGPTDAEYRQVGAYLAEQGDPLIEMTDNLMAARRAFVAIVRGQSDAATVEEFMEALTSLSTTADDLLVECDALLYPQAQDR